MIDAPKESDEDVEIGPDGMYKGKCATMDSFPSCHIQANESGSVCIYEVNVTASLILYFN